MVYRLSWVAGIAGIGLALVRLERLLRPTAEGLPWELVLLAAALLGAAITWAGTAYRINTRLLALINLAAIVITVVRVAVPTTTWYLFPTLESFSELRLELEFARDVIRSGVAPVIPMAGLIAILAIVFWALGALLSWGLLTGRPYLAVLAPLVVYLQFATMDRSPGGWWLWLFLIFLGGALLAVAFDRRREGSGLLTSSVTKLAAIRSLPSLAIAALIAVLAVSILATNAVAPLIPRSGLLSWRVPTGLTGEYYGGLSYNPFVGIQQGLTSQTNTPVFVAEVEGDIDPERVYWRLVTLETFNGSQWLTDQPQISLPEEVDSFEDEYQQFRGPTISTIQSITILALQMGWLPAAYSPTEMTANNRAVARGFRVKNDASLRFDALTYRGMTYRVTSEVPDPDIDALSLADDGALSVVFAGAAEDGAFEPGPPGQIASPVAEARELEEPDLYLDLPDDIEPGVASLAREQTELLTTDFERGLALEAFFRAPGRFEYSVDIEPGHGAEDLSDWLLDPESPNYRTGYCEQFATAMAVMARQVGVPSRVVLGFTPGAQLEDGRVVVRDRNAHAWVELWMPTQGWVRFDPTPRGDGVNPATFRDLPFEAEAYLDIPAPEAPPPRPPAGDSFIPPGQLDNFPIVVGGGEGTPDERPSISIPGWVFPVLAGALAVFGLLPLYKWTRRRMRMRRLAGGDISAAWEEIVDRLSDLRMEPGAAMTPLEVAEETDEALVPLADAYGRAAYGDPKRRQTGAVAVATESLNATERRLSDRVPARQRILSWYRIRSVVPTRLRRRKRS